MVRGALQKAESPHLWLETQTREQAGNGLRLRSLKACPQWCTFSSKAASPKLPQIVPPTWSFISSVNNYVFNNF